MHSDLDNRAELFALKSLVRDLARKMAQPNANGTSIKLVEAFLDHAPSLYKRIPHSVHFKIYNEDADDDEGDGVGTRSIKSQLLEKLQEAFRKRPTGFFYDVRCYHHLKKGPSDSSDQFDQPARWRRTLDSLEAIKDQHVLAGLLEEFDLSEEEIKEDMILHCIKLAHTDKYVTKCIEKLESKALKSTDSVENGSILSGKRKAGDTKMTKGSKEVRGPHPARAAHSGLT